MWYSLSSIGKISKDGRPTQNTVEHVVYAWLAVFKRDTGNIVPDVVVNDLIGVRVERAI